MSKDSKIANIEQSIPKEIKEEAAIYEKLREAELKAHPKYMSIVKRLDQAVFVGDLSEGVKLFECGDYTVAQLDDAFYDSFKYVEDNLPPEEEGKKLFINVSPKLFNMIRYVTIPMEITNIDLNLWKYKKWIMCEAEELRECMFNVYTLKPEE